MNKYLNTMSKGDGEKWHLTVDQEIVHVWNNEIW
jgi:hypothetical protein